MYPFHQANGARHVENGDMKSEHGDDEQRHHNAYRSRPPMNLQESVLNWLGSVSDHDVLNMQSRNTSQQNGRHSRGSMNRQHQSRDRSASPSRRGSNDSLYAEPVATAAPLSRVPSTCAPVPVPAMNMNTYEHYVRSDQNNGTRLMPKHFNPPVTCYFWHMAGSCQKEDHVCEYAHVDTGVYAPPPPSVDREFVRPSMPRQNNFRHPETRAEPTNGPQAISNRPSAAAVATIYQQPMNVEQRAHNLAIREHLVQENMTKCMNIVGRTRWMLNQLQGVAEDFASDKDDEVRQAAKDTLLGRLSNEMRLLEDLFDQSHRA